ncbi:hypothetical protein RRG08_052182 [Elysia crispata]|uniref:Uncharacterized protein n=1 Tax=Elysia crispata TaxID=231223 RepID=A0AAE0YZY8_9GAST|nr:hypothetical protein RRG08_052182 [Elysia crispata]
MQNVAFTAKGDHIAWTLGEQLTMRPSVVFGYKGIPLIFGIFLAYETQNMRLKQVNDSRFVGMSIYNIVARNQKGVLFSETQTSLNFHFDSCEDGV